MLLRRFLNNKLRHAEATILSVWVIVFSLSINFFDLWPNSALAIDQVELLHVIHVVLRLSGARPNLLHVIFRLSGAGPNRNLVLGNDHW